MTHSTTGRGRTRKKWVAAFAIPVTVGLALAGCATTEATPNNSADGASDAAPVAGGTLDVAFWPDNAAFPCVDPFQVYWIESRSLIRNFADSLTDQDPETGEIVPWLATDWEISDDGTEYTFNLRDDVTFSDGTPFNAESVKLTFDENAKAVKELTPPPFGASYIQSYKSTEVVDDDTVKITLSEPNSSFLQATSTTNLAILAASSYENTPEERCLGGVVGSGLFVLDSYTPGESAKLSKRTGYAWPSELSENKGEAYLDGITISYVAEDSVRVGNLTSGAVDVAWPRNPFTQEDRTLIEASNAYLESRPLPGVSYTLFPNVANGGPLEDPKVRQALYGALDLQTYATTIYGEGYPVVGGIYDSTTPYFVSQADKLAFDPEGSAALLDEAGWELGDDGYRYKDGKKLTLVEPILAETPGDVLTQDQLKQVGIDLELKVITAAERADILTNGDYDLTTNYLTRGDPGVLQSVLRDGVALSAAVANNAQDAETKSKVEELFHTALSSTDTDEIATAYADLQNLSIDEGVNFPIFERVQYVGLSNKVHGFAFTSEAFLRANDIWVES